MYVYKENRAKLLPGEGILRATEADMAAQGIVSTLAERGARYGPFIEHGRVAQNIKTSLQDSNNWHTLDPDMKEAFDMFANKAGRILNGDPHYHDSWHDIVGYFTLVADRLIRDRPE